jgi:high-affinity Fe2+/Pb2+ permease
MHVTQAWLFALAGAVLGFGVVQGDPYLIINGAIAGFIANGLLYLGVRKFRAWTEARAYAEQMCWPNGKGGWLSLDNAAYRLALPQYNLRLTDVEARKAILNH